MLRMKMSAKSDNRDVLIKSKGWWSWPKYLKRCCDFVFRPL